jgi:GNAT superfamily N-acetyltransferase
MTGDAAPAEGLSVHPLTAVRWPDLERLVGPNGAYSNCWCTWWRQTGSDFDAGCRHGGAGNRALLRSLTEAGDEPGLIAYRGGEPVGWVSVSPRPEFGRILRSRVLGPMPDEAADTGTWAVVCFWMPRKERGRGLATVLLGAAIAHARARGARALEAYPVDTLGERRSADALFTGPLPMYLAAGFREVERRSPRRPIVRLTLET